MNVKLHKPVIPINGVITLPGSKSISNRVLIIKALSGLDFQIENLSSSDDTKLLEKALLQIANGSSDEINIGHAGTDMRFLTAYLSIKKGKWILSGSDRIQQRPIMELVNVLNNLGANSSFLGKENYPPLLIEGASIMGGKTTINGSISSQFISSLLLIAPYFQNGLELHITGEMVSRSYIEMTMKVMQDFGASMYWKENMIIVNPIPYTFNKSVYIIESDWSAASYYYSLVALSKATTTLTIKKLFNTNVQPDSICEKIYSLFGVVTEFSNDELILTKSKQNITQTQFNYDFTNCPDIAQTLACTCLGLGIPFHFTGLNTLKIKETNRILALKNEFKKWNANLIITDTSIALDEIKLPVGLKEVCIATYQDHRMAMSFAPLCIKYSDIMIAESEVVSKSYPSFWEDLKSIGISIETVCD